MPAAPSPFPTATTASRSTNPRTLRSAVRLRGRATWSPATEARSVPAGYGLSGRQQWGWHPCRRSRSGNCHPGQLALAPMRAVQPPSPTRGAGSLSRIVRRRSAAIRSPAMTTMVSPFRGVTHRMAWRVCGRPTATPSTATVRTARCSGERPTLRASQGKLFPSTG